MENTRKKTRKKNGFTLLEMLIVVAIIAILVAVSIPMANGVLERTRVATDAANERAAKAEAELAFFMDFLPDNEESGQKYGLTFLYDAAAGQLVDVNADLSQIKPYGKCTQHANKYIFISYDQDGSISLKWGTSVENATDEGNHNGVAF